MIRRVTTQDVSWFLDLAKNAQLELNPPYQRRSVWTRKDRQFFLDTVFRGYPCPPIFLHKEISQDGKQTHNVVDGKQRLETLLLFSQGKLSIPKTFGDANLDGKKWDDLDAAAKHSFWNYVFSVEFLSLIDGQLINEAFDRLNRNSRKLQEQELRHSQFSGWMITFVESESDQKIWKDLGVVTAARAKRMQDVQFLSELLLVTIERKIHGFDQDLLTEKYGDYDSLEEGDLQDSVPGWVARFSETKDFLYEMEQHNGSVSRCAATLHTFYTLWAYLTLFSPPKTDAKAVAERFMAFQGEVDSLRKADPEDRAEIAGANPVAYRFFENSRGASTDLGPRNERLLALKEALALEEEPQG